MAEVMQKAVSGAEKRRQALFSARRRDSDAKRARVCDTVQKMLIAGEQVTFTGVARQAKVSSWLVYADGVRELVDSAIRQQAEEPLEANRSVATPASLRTDLALAREEVNRLRTDNDKLRRNVQRLLGQQLDQVKNRDLLARVDNLVSQNGQLTGELGQATLDNANLRKQIIDLEEDIVAVRTALRRMIREQSVSATT
jgi:phage shock protein A